jgi:hypothetical protein
MEEGYSTDRIGRQLLEDAIKVLTPDIQAACLREISEKFKGRSEQIFFSMIGMVQEGYPPHLAADFLYNRVYEGYLKEVFRDAGLDTEEVSQVLNCILQATSNSQSHLEDQ